MPAHFSIRAVLIAALLAGCADDSIHLGGTGGDDSTSSASSTGGFTTSGSHDDGGGGTGSNTMPVAFAGQDREVHPGEEIVLDGSGSYDPDGGLLAFQWHISGSGRLVDSMTVSPTFTAPTFATTVLVTLEVTDDEGEFGSDDVELTIAGFPPILSAGADVGGLAGDTLSLAADASDPDGDPITYTWTQISGPAVALSDSTSAPSLTLPAGLTEHLVYEVVASDEDGESAPDWVTVVELTGPDTDGDLVEDATEAALGTNPASPDTDADGIPDGWELGVHEGVDYAALGCDPLHKDVLVEIDHQAELLPGDTLLNAWTAYYASLAIANPDGGTGIAFHPVIDSVLPATFVCPQPLGGGGSTPLDNPLYRETFHQLSICVGGGFGLAESIGGRHFAISVVPPNADPSDDLVEEAVFDEYWIMLHELGHSLGLFHGGGDDVNHKPNYPSYMNYAYPAAALGSPRTLSEGVARLSRGVRPAIDECAVVEAGIFGGLPAADTAYLPFYPDASNGWAVSADGSVDWNRDNVIAAGPYELIVRSSTEEWGTPNHPDCTLLVDWDDESLISTKMAATVPADPAAGPPTALRLRPRFIDWRP